MLQRDTLLRREMSNHVYLAPPIPTFMSAHFLSSQVLCVSSDFPLSSCTALKLNFQWNKASSKLDENRLSINSKALFITPSISKCPLIYTSDVIHGSHHIIALSHLFLGTGNEAGETITNQFYYYADHVSHLCILPFVFAL